jgi:hypothetical protein
MAARRRTVTGAVKVAVPPTGDEIVCPDAVPTAGIHRYHSAIPRLATLRLCLSGVIPILPSKGGLPAPLASSVGPALSHCHCQTISVTCAAAVAAAAAGNAVDAAGPPRDRLNRFYRPQQECESFRVT